MKPLLAQHDLYFSQIRAKWNRNLVEYSIKKYREMAMDLPQEEEKESVVEILANIIEED